MILSAKVKYFPKQFSIQALFVVDQVQKWTKKYPLSVRENIDLLFYMNLQDVYIQYQGYALPKDNIDYIEQAGWRSVSVVENSCAFVVFANAAAPTFIKKVAGIIVE